MAVSGMPHDTYEAALDSFIEDLNRIYHVAGSPSYTQLENASARLRARGGPIQVIVLTRANTWEILHGRRKQLRWDWLRSFVTVLLSMARPGEFSADSIGTVDDWRQRYEALFAAKQAARRPAAVGRHRKQSSPGSTDRTEPPAPEEPEGPEEKAPGSEVLRLLGQASIAHWLHSYRDIAPSGLNNYVCLESGATVIRTYEPEILPGLLQAEPYARAILRRYSPEASDSEITRLVELRMRRQDRLREPEPDLRLWAVIEETALRSHQVDAQAMRSQITNLINMSELPNVTLQVLLTTLPPELDDHVTIKEPITHFRFPAENHDDVIFIERSPDGVILADRKEIEHYSHLLSRLGKRAARGDDVRDLLRKIFTEL
jgi:hypothetical protein